MKKRDIIVSNDAQAVNFREIHIGKIAPNTLYRSSHPIKDNDQEKVISLLAARARIATVLNLSDTNSEIKIKSIFAPWYDELFKNNRVIGLGMDFNNNSESFSKKLKKGLQFIINTEGPWLIHCHAGVDRTGFVSIVLEALMGAALDDIINDYLMSFNSIYDSSIYGEVNKRDSLVVMQLLSAMGNYMPVNDQNLQAVAENYLRSAIKLSDVEIKLLKGKLAGNTET
ncbi:MAG: tyrosine-protein phosphatase [Treponema sp.]|jgi:protein tyrosine/serine phosphatase|nr:tyrosine-protein phosphatase [Treponema sp.]